jgi:hypothetical protein
MGIDHNMQRALEHDDHLELRRSRAGRGPSPEEGCIVLFDYEERCDQCSRRTRRPHLMAGCTTCARCRVSYVVRC